MQFVLRSGVPHCGRAVPVTAAGTVGRSGERSRYICRSMAIFDDLLSIQLGVLLIVKSQHLWCFHRVSLRNLEGSSYRSGNADIKHDR